MFEEQRKTLHSLGSDKRLYRERFREDAEYSLPSRVPEIKNPSPDFTKSWESMSFGEKAGATFDTIRSGDFINDYQKLLAGGVKNIGDKSGQILTSPTRAGRMITDKLGIKRDETSDDIIGKLSKIGQVGLEAAVRQVPGVSLFGGEEMQASRENTDSFGLKLADAIGSLGGALPSIGLLTNAGMKVITFSGALKWAEKYPRLYSSIVNGLSQAGAMGATGQINMPLETEFKDRIKGLVHDAGYGAVFGASGGLFKSFWAAVPAGGVINATQAYLDGGDTKDVTIAALIGSAMEGAFRMGTIRNPEAAARNMAADIFNKNGVDINTKSSVSDIAKAYQDLTAGGKVTSVERERLGRAYQILTNTKPELTSGEATDMAASIKKASEIVKGTRQGNQYDGDVVASREIARIKPEEISTQQDLLDRMREMKLKKETIKQVADAFNVKDTPDAPTKYDDISVDDMKRMVMEKSVSKSMQDSVQALPPVKDGFVRLYHSGSDSVRKGDYLDTIESKGLERRAEGDGFVVYEVPESMMKSFKETGDIKSTEDGIMISDVEKVPEEYVVARQGKLQDEMLKVKWDDFVKNNENIDRVKDDPQIKPFLEAIAKEKEIADNLHKESTYAQGESSQGRVGAGIDGAPVAQEVAGQQGADQKPSAAPAQTRTEGTERVQQGAQKEAGKPESDRLYGINVKKYGFDPEVEGKFRAEIEQLSKKLEENKGGTLKQSDVKAVMERVEAENRVVSKEQTAKEIAAVKNAQARIKELKTREEELTRDGKELSPSEKEELTDLIYVVASHATKAGRSLQAFKMMVEKKPMFDRIVEEASKKGIDVDTLKENMRKYNLDDTADFIRFYRKTFGWTWKEAMDEYVYGNLLSSPRSLLRNAWYGVLQAGVIRPADLLWTEPRSIPDYYKGMAGSFKLGKDAFIKSWKQENINLKGDVYDNGQRVPVSTLSKYWTVGPRLMEASDRFMMEILRGAEVSRMMGDKSLSQGDIAKEAERVAERMLGRTPLKRSNEQYQGWVGDVLDSTGRFLNDQNSAAGTTGKFVVRFVRTVLNITKDQYQHSPLGITEMWRKSARKEVFGKVMTGTMVTILGAMKASDDETTFYAPTNEKEKEIFYASGRKPFSIKIGDKWIPFVYFGPVAFALAIPAAFHYYDSQNRGTYAGTRGEKILSSIGGAMSVFLQTTPVGPMSDLMDSLVNNKGNAIEKTGANIASQFIPFVSLLAYLSDVFDPVAREAKSGVDSIKRKLPFIKEQLTPYMDIDNTPADYDWSHFILPYDIGEVDRDGDKLWNKMWLDSIKGVYSDKKLKELKGELEKDSLREKGYMK